MATPELIPDPAQAPNWISASRRAPQQLSAEGRKVRGWSRSPAVELFEEQGPSYRESVLPAAVRKRVVVEASGSFRLAQSTGGFDGCDRLRSIRFGVLGPWRCLTREFGFTVANVVRHGQGSLSVEFVF